MNNMIDIYRASSQLEELLLGKRYELRTHIDEMPWLTFPAGYSLKMTFPFNGAAVRFRVCKSDKPENDVSVYLDMKNVLGYFGAPYWEAYPIGEDTARFALNDTKELVEAIIGQLNPSNNPKE